MCANLLRVHCSKLLSGAKGGRAEDFCALPLHLKEPAPFSLVQGKEVCVHRSYQCSHRTLTFFSSENKWKCSHSLLLSGRGAFCYSLIVLDLFLSAAHLCIKLLLPFIVIWKRWSILVVSQGEDSRCWFSEEELRCGLKTRLLFSLSQTDCSSDSSELLQPLHVQFCNFFAALIGVSLVFPDNLFWKDKWDEGTNELQRERSQQ